MDWRLFFGTFALIFFAELGDKTQLAAMATAAGHKSLLSVFLGASLALVFSTLIAVVLGSLLQKFIPIHYIKLTAAILFLIFGCLLLYNVLQGEQATTETPEPEAAEAPALGFLSTIALQAAIQFEEAVNEDYHELTQNTQNPELRELFRLLEKEENEHIKHMHDLLGSQPEHATHINQEDLTVIPRFLRTNGALPSHDQDILQAAMQQEKAKVAFYKELARATLLPGPHAIFSRLAREEQDHYNRLARWNTSAAS